MSEVHEHPSLNHVYGTKITTPPTLTVFMKYYSKFVLLYKPLNLFKATEVWLQLLVQYFADNNIKERGITVERFTEVMRAFEDDYDKDHVVDRQAALEARADDDFTVDEKDGPAREMPTPQFEKICLDFIREAIRYSPSEIIKFAQRYFKALEQDKVVKYLQKMADRSAKDRPQRLSTEEDLLKARDYLARQQGLSESDADDMDKNTTLKLIQKTLNAATEERKKRNAELRKQLDIEVAAKKAEEEEKEKEIMAKLKEKDIHVDTEAEKKLMASPRPARLEETVDMFSPASPKGDRSSFHAPTDGSLLEKILGSETESLRTSGSSSSGSSSSGSSGSSSSSTEETKGTESTSSDSSSSDSSSSNSGSTSPTNAGSGNPEDEDPELAERIRKRKEAVARRQEEKRRAAEAAASSSSTSTGESEEP